MQRMILIVTVAIMLFSPVQAANPGQNYFGLQYALTEFDLDVSGLDDFEPTALVGKFGHFVNENVAIEGRFGIGLQDDDQDFGPFDLELEIEQIFGIYGVFQTSGNGSTSFYGIVGFSDVEAELSLNGASDTDDESGLSYGVGLNISGFNAEYMIYLDEDDVEVTAISLGYVGYF